MKQWMQLDCFWLDLPYRLLFIIIPENPYSPLWPMEVPELLMKLAENDGAQMLKEFWVNVYEYETVKNTQFYSHRFKSKNQADHRGILRKIVRPDSKCIYRIHVKMKEVNSGIGKFKPKYEWQQPNEHYSKLFE